MIPDELTGGPHFDAFCRRYIKHTKGRWAGQTLVLEDWQREFWWEALELDPATGLRVYQEVGLGLPRKNSKSTMCSAAGMYFVLADGEAEPEVYIGAGAQHQANIVYAQMRSMVRTSGELLKYIPTPGQYRMETRSGGIVRSLASDGALQHGLNPSCNIIDEIHAHKNGDLYTALTTGTAAREQPFTIWITTAGVAGEGILAELYDSMFTGSGELEKRGEHLLIYRDRANGTLIYWYGAGRDADIADPAVWRATNPASWLQDGLWLGQQHARLAARGALLEWRQYHLNQFTDTSEQWLPEGRWAECQGDLELDPKLPVGIGTDRAPDGSLGAIVIAQRQGELVAVKAELFPPERASGLTSAEAMRRRLRELRLAFPAAMAREENSRRPVPGPSFGFDRVAFRESAELLEQDGLNMVDLPMAASTMAPPTTMTYELISERRLRHDGDRLLAEHVSNTTAILTDRGMKVTRPKVKGGSGRPNVAAIAMVRAVALAMQEPPKPFGVRTVPSAVGF